MEEQKDRRGGDSCYKPSLPMKRRMVAALRQFCVYFHAPRKQAKEDAKVRIPVRKKDGTLGKKYTVAYKCAICGDLTVKPDMDHIDPVGVEPDYPYDIMELLHYIKRLLAPYDGWQCICKPCHKKKTAKERSCLRTSTAQDENQESSS